MENNNKFYHIMFLPVIGSFDHDTVFNVVLMAAFFGAYIWYVRHEHKHSEELLAEVKKIREQLEGDSES